MPSIKLRRPSTELDLGQIVTWLDLIAEGKMAGINATWKRQIEFKNNRLSDPNFGKGNEKDINYCIVVVDDTLAPTPTINTPPFPTSSSCKDDPTFRKGKKNRKCAYFGKKNGSKRCRKPGVEIFQIVKKLVTFVIKMERKLARGETWRERHV